MKKELLVGMKAGMLFFGERTSALVNAVLLTLVYVLGVGSMNLLARIVGKKFLELDLGGTSYWVEKHEVPEKLRRYYRQF